jgi:nucleotide-binding universal stress UspA family protein
MTLAPPNKIKKIIVAVDGSEHSYAAVSLIRDFSIDNISCPECLITVIGVLNPLDSASHNVYKVPLFQAQKMLQERCFQVQTELILGYPAEIIINYAEENRPDLIVMGAKGLRATLGILLGGVAQQVIEYACCPVLIVRAPYRPLKHILLVTDGSTSSSYATEYLAAFPLPKQAEIIIVHVLPPSPILEPGYLLQTWSLTDDAIQNLPPLNEEEIKARQAEEEKHGKDIIEQTRSLLKGIEAPIHTHLLRGDTATEIIHHIQQNNIDMIVAGSRGLSQMKGWLLGSVSRKLVHYANCSVLVVKKLP